MVTYDSSLIYVNSTTTIEGRLAKVRAIIDALYLLAATAATTGQYDSYEVDDGQATIKTKYRSMSDVQASINAFERMEQRYLSQLNGRRIRLVNEKNFRQCL